MGLISYPLYLWRWVVLSFVNTYVGKQLGFTVTVLSIALSLRLKLMTLKFKSYLRSVASLATGSLVSQFILVVASPILTRIYTPEDFSEFSVYIAALSIFSIAASGRYEIALVISDKQHELKNLFDLSMVIIGVTFVATSITAIIAKSADFPIKNITNLVLLLLPFAIAVSATSNVYKYLATSMERYKLISKLMICQSIIAVFFYLLIGYLDLDVNGLVLGSFIGAVASYALYKNKIGIGRFRWDSKIIDCAKKYKDLPVYNATTALIDTCNYHLPFILLLEYYGETVSGYYGLIIRVAMTPLAFIAQSVSQVHLKTVSDMIKNGESRTKYMSKLSLGLFLISIVPTIILYSYGSFIFQTIFGKEWEMAGQLMSILVPAIALKFVVSTMSGVFSAAGRLRQFTILKVASIAILFFVFYFLAGKVDVFSMFYWLMASEILIATVFYALIWWAVLNPKKL